MYALRVEDDRGEIRRVVVDGDIYAIGRADDNDLVLADINVSRHHARLEVRPMGIVLVDAGSTYGIRMNGLQAPGEVLLQGGDVFVMGDYRFELAPAEGSVSPTSTVRMTKVQEEAPPTETASVQVKAVPGMEGEPGVHYTVAMSEDESLKILLEIRQNMMVGVNRAGGVDDDMDDDSADMELSDEERRGKVMRTVLIIVLLGAGVLLGWLLYSMYADSDQYLGSVHGTFPTELVAGAPDLDSFPRS